MAIGLNSPLDGIDSLRNHAKRILRNGADTFRTHKAKRLTGW